MKTGKEIKNNKFKNYTVVFGSVNNKNPKAVYINISAWAEPLQSEDVNYTRVIKDINKKIKKVLFSNFYSDENCDFISNDTIVDLDIRESGIKFGKRSFMNCEITLFSNKEQSINSDKMLDNIDNVISIIIKSVFEENNSFDFHKKKK